ncbi:hypothetical protein FKM82_003048 [Ascaphus truei]
MGHCLCCTEKCNSIEDAENRFRVINVDDDGKKMCPGVMELTETCLIFHLKKGGFVKWPYRSLLKYGCDSDLFSFICGRRCQTGEGIFGFKCHRAEELFNMLQCSMQNNRISVISETDCDSPASVQLSEQRLLYRSEKYPSFPAASSVLSSSQRPEPIGGEIILESASPHVSEQAYSTKAQKEERMRHKGHLTLEQKTSGGGISQASYKHNYLEVEKPLLSVECQGVKCYQKPTYIFRSQIEREELGKIEGFHYNGDSNYAVWDIGYDSDERREASCIRRMGYENIGVLPSECLRSRSCMISVSSSDSQNIGIVPTQSPAVSFESQPSSPSVLEEKSSLEQKTCSSAIEANRSEHALLKRHSAGRETMTRQDCPVTYFNFDVRQPAQESRQLNYIQVEVESGCDSDNPQTPQSPNTTSISWTTSRQSEFYTELDLEKTAALSLIQRYRPQDDGTRKTRHSSKYYPV